MNIVVICGIPKLEKNESEICGPCQVGKQLKGSHKVLQQITTTKVLELLHMVLIRPMQVESTSGKRYVFVCVDYFFIFIWMEYF